MQFVTTAAEVQFCAAGSRNCISNQKMGIEIVEINHVNITVPKSAEEAAKHFYGVIPDDRLVRGWARFYLRDPGGNRIEVAQDVRKSTAEAQTSQR